MYIFCDDILIFFSSWWVFELVWLYYWWYLILCWVMILWSILHLIVKTFWIFQGSVSVSMSIHQTLFCFICSHLTSGEKEGDELKRNADVHEILRRTHFQSLSYIGLPKRILDHEWVHDLIYHGKQNCYFTSLLKLLYIFPHCMFQS